jgi:hypothetical protein
MGTAAWWFVDKMLVEKIQVRMLDILWPLLAVTVLTVLGPSSCFGDAAWQDLKQQSLHSAIRNRSVSAACPLLKGAFTSQANPAGV